MGNCSVSFKFGFVGELGLQSSGGKGGEAPFTPIVAAEGKWVALLR